MGTTSKELTPALKAPDGDGWIPWPEDEHGNLRQPLEQLSTQIQIADVVMRPVKYDGRDRKIRPRAKTEGGATHG